MHTVVWKRRMVKNILATYFIYRIKSTKTTSMEDVSTGVLEKIKNIYEVKIKQKKMIWCITTSTTPNVARTISCKAWNSPAEYPSWVARCDIKGSDGTMLNPIFWKKVLGHKHPGRWGIVKHQIPSIKVLFKTNTKCHKHPGIKLLSESKTQLVNQRKQDSYRIAHTHTHLYIYIHIYIYIYIY